VTLPRDAASRNHRNDQSEEAMPPKPATPEELKSFFEKLAAFHDTLEPGEQQFLDDMTASALGREEPEVQGFVFNVGFGNAQGMRQVLGGLADPASSMSYYRALAKGQLITPQ